MALFLSTYVNKIDRKGRISVPAPFRLELAGQEFPGIVAYPSFREGFKAIEGCGIDRMEQLSEGVDDLNPYSDDNADYASALFESAFQLAFDGEGRVVLPGSLRDHAGIGDLAAFVGRGKTFQIWQPEAHKIFRDEAKKRLSENSSGLRISRSRGTEDGRP